MSFMSNPILKFISNVFLQKPFSEYSSLSDNTIESEAYEIRKLIDERIDKVLFIPEANILLVKTGEYLWKINADGYVIDTWDSKGCMFSSGYCFTEDYYVDWVHTGNKARQKYSKLVDARNMSEVDLIRYLDKAEVVEFFADYKRGSYKRKDSDRLGMAFLKMKDHTVALDITNHYDRIDTHCDKIKYEFYFGEGEYQKIGWDKSCLDKYQKKYQDKLQFVGNSLPYTYDWEDKSQSVFIQKFVKEGYVIREGFFFSLWMTIINGLTRIVGQPIVNKWFLFEGHWLGTAYLQIEHHAERLNFKVQATYDESDTVKSTPIAMIDFPSHKNAEMKFIRGNGLYALRKKISHITKAEKELEQNNIILGHSSSYRTHNPWQPVFAGLMSTPTANYHRSNRSKKGRSDSARNRLPTWGKIHFYNSKDEPHNYLSDNAAVPTGLYSIPKKLSFNWEGDNTNSAFKLYLDNGQFAWYHLHDANTDEYHLYAPDTDVYLELIFDEAEMVAAFQALDKGKYPLQLELQMEKKGTTAASLSVYLRNKKQRIQFKNNQYAYNKPRYFNDEPFFTQQFEKSKLEIEYENALKDGEELQAYLDVASDIAKNSPYAKEYASALFSQTNELINISATKNDAKTAEKVIVHFLDKILPYTGRTGKAEDVALNAEVIASNSLAHAISTRNKELSTVILEKLLGKNFEIKEINNGTLLFNLACYYAVYKDKNRLLLAARQAMIRGKQADQFMKEVDFKEYWNDPDFMKMLAAAPVASGETEQSNK